MQTTRTPRRGGLAAPLVLGALALGAIGIARALPRIPQPKSYHRFPDRRSSLVLTNAPFVTVGVRGVGRLLGRGGEALVEGRAERMAYLAFFGALALTGLGSAYYHQRPNHGRLVWDRLPMTAAMTALVAAVVAERAGERAGRRALPLGMAMAAASVAYWYASERRGRGDLRPYGVVQALATLALPVLVGTRETRYTHGGHFMRALGWFQLARVCEVLDRPIHRALSGTTSGHALKHLFAARAGRSILRMLEQRSARLEGVQM